MKISLVLFVFWLSPFLFADTSLYNKVYDSKVADGKTLSMTIQETERSADTSVFVVTFKSGGSVPSSMAIARACFDVAKIRNVKYFIKLKEWTDSDSRWHYIIGFANEKHPSPATFFKVKIPDGEKNALTYVAIADFSLLFDGSRGKK